MDGKASIAGLATRRGWRRPAPCIWLPRRLPFPLVLVGPDNGGQQEVRVLRVHHDESRDRFRKALIELGGALPKAGACMTARAVATADLDDQVSYLFEALTSRGKLAYCPCATAGCGSTTR